MSGIFGSGGGGQPSSSGGGGLFNLGSTTAASQTASSQPSRSAPIPFTLTSQPTAGSQPPRSTPILFSLAPWPTANSQPPSSGPTLFNFTSQPTAPAASGSSLFPSLGGGATSAAPTQPSAGGLFGNLLGKSQPASTAGGLFPSLGTTSKPATSGGLFGLGTTTQTQQPTASSLFPSLGQPSQPQQPTGGGLFPSLGQSTQPQQSTGGSIFGGLGQSIQQNQTQNQTQGQPDTSQPASSAPTAYFDQILERGRKRNSQENGVLGDLPSLQLGLGDIARKVRNLGTGGPSAQQAQAGIGPRQSQRAGDSRAHYLLAASGVSTAAALRDLNNFSAQAGAGLVPSKGGIADTDVESFVSNLQSQSTMDMIQEGLEQSKRDFDKFLEENVQMNWDSQRQRIYEHFGLVKPSDTFGESSIGGPPEPSRERGASGRSSRRQRTMGASNTSGMSFGQSGMTKSVLGNSAMKSTMRGSTFTDVPEKNSTNSLVSGTEDRLQRDKQEKYAEKVRALNVARVAETCYPVLHNFVEAEQDAGIDGTASLVSAYKALVSIVNEPSSTLQPTDAGAVRERQYAKLYLDETPTSQQNMGLRKRIINGSRVALENMFFKKITTIIDKDPRVAEIGGIPSTISTIRGYIRILANRKELGEPSQLQKLTVDENEDCCWVLIYFLLRCGFVSEAAQYVADNQRSIRSIDRNFTRYMDQYAKSPDRRLSQDTRQHINNEYHSRMRSAPEDSLDPYRMACYKIIGRCELSRRVLDIGTDEEDWIWLQFALAREVPKTEEMAGEVFGLEQIQETVKDIGRRHFSQGAENPGGFGTYFFLQILAGMFEQAIATLYPHNHLTAVHFAIALDYYGLLRVADLSATELVSYTTRQQPKLHFALVIGYYTGDFRAAKPETATDYLVLLNLNADLPGDAGVQQAKICWEALRELVLETREFACLLGDVRGDGTRQPGAIEKRISLIRLKDDYAAGKRKSQAAMYDTKQFIDNLTVQAAVAADDAGRTTDAVLLYHLAGEYDNVIAIINRTLSEALSVELGQEQMRLEPLKPRSKDDAGQPIQEQHTSTLSLTSVDDPVILAQNMSALYGQNALVLTQIKEKNREACDMLQRLSHAKHLVAESQYMPALGIIQSTKILPLSAQGDINAIRTEAQNFADLPPVVARNIGDIMMWTIMCCGRQRDKLRNSGFDNDTSRRTAEDLLQAARDLMVFAGLIRFRLPPKVFEVLARAGQDFGV